MVRQFIIMLFAIATSGQLLCADSSLESLFEAQIRDYKNKNWSKVYVQGHIYRSHFLRNNEEIKASFSPNLYKLEIFSLAEKCQWEKVDVLFNEFKKLEKIKYKNKRHSDLLKKKLMSFKTYKLVSKEPAFKEEKNNDNVISVESIDWSKVKEYSDLDIEVEDLCLE